jgi:hypothetical protein
MAADPAQVFEEALTLDPGVRARLAHELLHGLELSDPDAAARWADELHERIDETETGTTELEDWATVRNRVGAATRR